MHYNACVLLLEKGSSREETEKKVDSILARFDINGEGGEDGQVDYWTVISEIAPHDRGRLLYGEGGEEKVVAVIVTPDGEWIEGPLILGRADEQQEKELDEWKARVKSIVEKYHRATAVLVDCHR